MAIITFNFPLWADSLFEEVDDGRFTPDSKTYSNTSVSYDYDYEDNEFSAEELEKYLIACCISYSKSYPSDFDGQLEEWVHFNGTDLNPVRREELKINSRNQEKLVKLLQDGNLAAVEKIIMNCKNHLPHPDFNVETVKLTSWNRLSMAILSGDMEKAEELIKSPDTCMKRVIEQGGLQGLAEVTEFNKIDDVKALIRLTGNLIENPGDISHPNKGIGWGLALLMSPSLYFDEKGIKEIVPLLYPSSGRTGFDERMVKDIELLDQSDQETTMVLLDVRDILPSTPELLERLVSINEMETMDAKLKAKLLSAKASSIEAGTGSIKTLTL